MSSTLFIQKSQKPKGQKDNDDDDDDENKPKPQSQSNEEKLRSSPIESKSISTLSDCSTKKNQQQGRI